MQHLISTIEQKEKASPTNKTTIDNHSPTFHWHHLHSTPAFLRGVSTTTRLGRTANPFRKTSRPRCWQPTEIGEMVNCMGLKFLRTGKWPNHPSIAILFWMLLQYQYWKIRGEVQLKLEDTWWHPCWNGSMLGLSVIEFLRLQEVRCTKTKFCFWKEHVRVLHILKYRHWHINAMWDKIWTPTCQLRKGDLCISLLLHGITWPSGNQLTPIFVHTV